MNGLSLLNISCTCVTSCLCHVLQTNSFQCVIAIGSSATYVLFKYADNGLKWAGQSPALVGFNAGDGVHSLVLPTSQTAEVLQITRTGNTASDGRWLFRVDQRSVTFPGKQRWYYIWWAHSGKLYSRYPF